MGGAAARRFRGANPRGRGGGRFPRKHSIQTELLLGTYYALMFNWANLEDYPIRRQAQAVARLLGDALCSPAGGGEK